MTHGTNRSVRRPDVNELARNQGIVHQLGLQEAKAMAKTVGQALCGNCVTIYKTRDNAFEVTMIYRYGICPQCLKEKK